VFLFLNIVLRLHFNTYHKQGLLIVAILSFSSNEHSGSIYNNLCKFLAYIISWSVNGMFLSSFSASWDYDICFFYFLISWILGEYFDGLADLNLK
jgi:hypothetical protein